ncbi:serine/threonine-protein kinase [Stigmatella sp. ncwal1]|uniref:non-specific serine/threonine protein kinase n=1 Tax=Stigmatella ashevillensis TaxID=2995309 RepID=A0ABT5DN03_9BACT|nr:serine/threonine-protein kinase [Stigmatella ashevillena]MDC0714983.1 serine/threonine-protein kinase [Stigmatella ashevillena]
MKRLAVGGMAELFLAQEPPKPGLVVLKRILPYLSEEPEFVQMFLDEARIAAQLHHPNIVQVSELGRLDNTIFIAMEFVEGIDLRRVMQEEGKFGANVPYGVAAAVCAQVAAGLDYAHHSIGVDGRPLQLIHRDVSPQNVMLAYDGRVKLVDFGIAKAGAFVERSKPGVIKGKFLYLSPEQVAQDKLDHRADIFALGTMMYEITTGKSPFAKPTTEGILFAIRSEDPSPPHLIKDDYPTELSRIIMRCLLKDRNVRYQRASEVQKDLEIFLSSGTLKQSTDVADYIARLMGEEEERTVLHIPIAAPAGRKDATMPMPMGLSARPARRATGEKAAVPEYQAEPEMPTQMSRPRGLSREAPEEPPEAEQEAEEEAEEAAGERELDDTLEPSGEHEAAQEEEAEPFEQEEEEERTAIGTHPARTWSASDGEFTVQERARSGRAPVGAVAPRRSGLPIEPNTEPRARRPSPPPDRRPLDEEDDDEDSQSISLTQPTVNQRLRTGAGDELSRSVSHTQPTPAPRGSRPGARMVPWDEDSPDATDSGLSEDLSQSLPPDTLSDEDESTGGYRQASEPPARRGRGWLLALAAGALFLALGGGLLWVLMATPEEDAWGDGPLQPVPLQPVRTGDKSPPAGPSGSEALPPNAPELAAGADVQAGEEPSAANNPPGSPVGNGAEDTPPAENAPPGAAAEPPSAVAAVAEPLGKKLPAEAVAVKFTTSSRTVIISVDGKRIEPNKVVSLPAGQVKVKYACSSARKPTKGSFKQTLKPDDRGAIELLIPCRKGQK